MDAPITPSTPDRLPSFLGRWWIWIPCKLHGYSGLLSAAWGDGFYLNAWPRLAVLLPTLTFLIGLFTGATHNGFFNIQQGVTRLVWVGATRTGLSLWLSTHPAFSFHPFVDGRSAVSFAQIFSLLLLGSAAGAISANLGLMLVTGYAVGDFFFAGPPQEWTYRYPSLSAHLFHLSVPQLISYLAFFMLAVLPTLNTRIMLVDLLRRGKLQNINQPSRKPLAILFVVVMAVTHGVFVYAWTLVAPMMIRISWTWAGTAAAPINVSQFQNVTEHWLPATAILCFLLRCLLEYRVSASPSLSIALRPMLMRARAERWKPRTPKAFSVWLNALCSGVVMAVLSIGFLWSIAAGFVFLAIVSGIFLIRVYALPKSSGWRNWSQKTAAMPIIIRALAAIAGCFLVTRAILSIDLRSFHYISPVFKNFSASINDKAPADFWVELLCIVVSSLFALALLPEGITISEQPKRLKQQISTNPSSLMGMILLFSIGDWTNFCLDPFCCFGASNLLVALMIAALILEAWPLLLALAELAEVGGLGELIFDAVMAIGPETSESMLLEEELGETAVLLDGEPVAYASRAEARQAFSGAQQRAANRFFRGATNKSSDFMSTPVRGGGQELKYFSAAKTPGYGKWYVQVIDGDGNVILEYKQTIGPNGVIGKPKWVHRLF